jgi:hypothetical protein
VLQVERLLLHEPPRWEVGRRLIAKNPKCAADANLELRNDTLFHRPIKTRFSMLQAYHTFIINLQKEEEMKQQ